MECLPTHRATSVEVQHLGHRYAGKKLPVMNPLAALIVAEVDGGSGSSVHMMGLMSSSSSALAAHWRPQ